MTEALKLDSFGFAELNDQELLGTGGGGPTTVAILAGAAAVVAVAAAYKAYGVSAAGYHRQPVIVRVVERRPI